MLCVLCLLCSWRNGHFPHYPINSEKSSAEILLSFLFREEGEEGHDSEIFVRTKLSRFNHRCTYSPDEDKLKGRKN